jgi:bacillithiol biosynthesis cysteine-adding enzyme BshC
MKVAKLALDKTGTFSDIFLDYLNGSPKLAPTHSFDPTIEGFEKSLSYRKLSQEHRNTLSKVLNKQYTGLVISEKVTANISLLSDQTTFTVTTGHQLNIFTGPLFFIYKIVSAINICKILKSKFPEYNFVPVYWMASEDHDFAEIDHTYVDGKKYQWASDQTGAVGRFSTDGLAELADTMPGNTAIFKNAYAAGETLAQAVRHYVNDLFGEEGLVVLDADNPELKAEFASLMEDDLLNHSAYKAVNNKSEYLVEQGYKPQLNPREINLFYLEDGLRSRIELDGDIYKVVDTEISFSKTEILDLLESNPEKFSPNVILRPLYQEVILPNLGYVGGPAELAYWLQYKEMFDFYKVDFPVLMPRTFGLYLNKNIQRKSEKLNLGFGDLFTEVEQLKKKYVHSLNANLGLESERHQVVKTYESLKKLASEVDVTLIQHVEAQLEKHRQCLDKIQNKFVKAEKRNREDEMAKIIALKEYTFPGGTLQERKVNFLSIPCNTFVNDVIENTDPFDLRMHIFLEN